MAKAGKNRQAKSTKRRPTLLPVDYLHQARLPLQSLLFLLPLVAIYEFGTLVYATDYVHGITQYIKARLWLLGFFEWFGVGGYYIPGLIVVVTLLSWHLARKDPWRLELKLYGWMYVESFLLALPLLMFMLILTPQPQLNYALAAGSAGAAPWQAEVIFSIGAGIYEELLFRLVGIALLHMLLVDVLAIPDLWGSAAAGIFSALAFALYHFSGPMPFSWSLFGLYTAAGIYLACVYVIRGIGIAAGTHAFYDILALVIKLL